MDNPAPLVHASDEAPMSHESAPGILVADDDQLLLSLLKTVLMRQGFVVWQAAAGQAAIDLYRRNLERIDMVLLDVRMPGMDGPQTLAELRRINPLLACCFMSGHTGQYTGNQLEDMGALYCFDKPFRAHELAQELWQLAQRCLRRAS
jgi:CheY-like chemotaxis protein